MLLRTGRFVAMILLPMGVGNIRCFLFACSDVSHFLGPKVFVCSCVLCVFFGVWGVALFFMQPALWHAVMASGERECGRRVLLVPSRFIAVAAAIETRLQQRELQRHFRGK